MSEWVSADDRIEALEAEVRRLRAWAEPTQVTICQQGEVMQQVVDSLRQLVEWSRTTSESCVALARVVAAAPGPAPRAVARPQPRLRRRPRRPWRPPPGPFSSVALATAGDGAADPEGSDW
jgi:hypothetical protein